MVRRKPRRMRGLWYSILYKFWFLPTHPSHWWVDDCSRLFCPLCPSHSSAFCIAELLALSTVSFTPMVTPRSTCLVSYYTNSYPIPDRGVGHAHKLIAFLKHKYTSWHYFSPPYSYTICCLASRTAITYAIWHLTLVTRWCCLALRRYI